MRSRRPRGSPGAGRHLDDLLMPSLKAAVALTEVHDRPLAVAKHLYLDVPRPRNELLHVQAPVAECGPRFRLAPRVSVRELGLVLDDAYPAAAAPGDRLQHHCAPGRKVRQERSRLGKCHRSAAPGQHGQTKFARRLARPGFVPKKRQGVRRRSYEREPSISAKRRKTSVLAEKPVPRVDRVATLVFRGCHELVCIEVRSCACPRQARGLVGKLAVQRRCIVVAVHGNGGDAHLSGGPDDAHGNFAAIRDEQPRNRHAVLRVMS